MAPEIETFLGTYPEPVAKTARALCALIAAARPEMRFRVLTGWRAIAWHHPAAGYVCGVFPFGDRVDLIFEHGVELADPETLLEGDGKQVRYLRFDPGAEMPEAAIRAYLAEAIALRA